MPPLTAEIFDRLSRGQFISGNSQDERKAELYRLLARHEDEFRAYFAPLGLHLEQGPGYYYFTRPDIRSALEDKVERTLRWLDWLDWLVQAAPSLGPGVRLVLADLLEATQRSAALRRQLRQLPLKGSPGNDEERLLTLMRAMEREGMVEQVTEKPVVYQLLAAIDYPIQLLSRIQPLND